MIYVDYGPLEADIGMLYQEDGIDTLVIYDDTGFDGKRRCVMTFFHRDEVHVYPNWTVV